MAAVKQNGNALKLALDEFQADRGIVMAAVKQTGHALQYASDDFKADRGIVMAAVKRHMHENALHYAPDQLKVDRNIVMAVVNQQESALSRASVMEHQNKLLEKSVETQAKQIQELEVALASSRPIESVDLAQEQNEGDSKKPSKRARVDEESNRPKSSLAMLSEMVKIKEEAVERADVAEKEKVEAEAKSKACIQIKKEVIEKAAVTEKEKEAALVKLECPICHDVQEETVAFIPCGHVMCVDCADIYAPDTCPTCRVHIESRLRLYK